MDAVFVTSQIRTILTVVVQLVDQIQNVTMDDVYVIVDNRGILTAVYLAVCNMVPAKPVYASADMENTHTVAEESAEHLHPLLFLLDLVHFPAEMELVKENVSLMVLDNVIVKMEVLCQIVFHPVEFLPVLHPPPANPAPPPPPGPPGPPPPPVQLFLVDVEKSQVPWCRKMLKAVLVGSKFVVLPVSLYIKLGMTARWEMDQFRNTWT